MSELARKRLRANSEPTKAYADRRSTLIKAAAEVFHAKGLSESTLHDISDSAGVDRASLYYYFDSKEQLFRAVLLESIEDVVGRAQAICNGSGTARRRLTELINHIVLSFNDCYPSLHIFVKEDLRKLRGRGDILAEVDAHRLKELADTYMSSLESLIDEGIQNGEFHAPADSHLLALVVQGALNSLHRWFSPTSGPAAAELADLFTSILLGGIVYP